MLILWFCSHFCERIFFKENETKELWIDFAQHIGNHVLHNILATFISYWMCYIFKYIFVVVLLSFRAEKYLTKKDIIISFVQKMAILLYGKYNVYTHNSYIRRKTLWVIWQYDSSVFFIFYVHVYCFALQNKYSVMWINETHIRMFHINWQVSNIVYCLKFVVQTWVKLCNF